MIDDLIDTIVKKEYEDEETLKEFIILHDKIDRNLKEDMGAMIKTIREGRVAYRIKVGYNNKKVTGTMRSLLWSTVFEF